jgi:Flp pilus assembly CpaE family ATPase
VLDIPRHLNAFSRACLRHSEQVVVVSELGLLSLRDVMRIGDMLRETYKMKPPLVVANRVGLAAKQEMMAADFEKAMGLKLSASIAFQPDIFMDLSGQFPGLKHREHEAVHALFKLAETIIPDAKRMPAAKEKKSFSLFKKPAKPG